LVAGGGDLEETGEPHFVSEDLHAMIKEAADRELGGAGGGGGGSSIADLSGDLSDDAVEKAVDDLFSGDADGDDQEDEELTCTGPVAKAKGTPTELETSELRQASYLAVRQLQKRRRRRQRRSTDF
jgi:hypothetical protein